MKHIYSLALTFLVLSSLSARADDLEKFQGKWSVKKTGDQGPYTQFLEFTKNKWKFKLVGGDGNTYLVAEGMMEVKEAEGLKILKMTGIKGGASESDLTETGDDRIQLYTFRDGKLHLAGNFEKERPNEKPSLEVYSKEK